MSAEHSDIGRLLRSLFEYRWSEVWIMDAVQERRITYGEFFCGAVRDAIRLTECNVKRGETVCLYLPNSLELLMLYFACLLKGVAAAPIDPQKGEGEVKEILSGLEHACVISKSEISGLTREHYLDLGLFRCSRPEDKSMPEYSPKILEELDYDRLFLISFTSGSTGIPKGVRHSFANLVRTAQAFNRKFRFGAGHVFYHILPMTYMAGILNLFILPLVTGAKIVLGSRFQAECALHFWSVPKQYGVNVFWLNPTLISLLLKLDRGKEGADYAAKGDIIGLVGTAPLSAAQKKAFEEKYGIALYESYGLSELLFLCTNSALECDKVGSVGRPLEGVAISLDEDGEILADAPWKFLGYTNEDTARYFKEGRYQTGDLGYFAEDGGLIISGRKKDLIIRGGINISPVRIETFLQEYGACIDQTVLGVPDEILGEKTVCFYVPGPAFDAAARKQMNRQLGQTLGKDYLVDEFVEVAEIPKNLNGKTDKALLQKNYRNRRRHDTQN